MFLPNLLAVLHSLCDLRVASSYDEAQEVPVWTRRTGVRMKFGVKRTQRMEKVSGMRFEIDCVRTRSIY